MVRDRARKLDTRTHAEAHGLTYEQAAQDLARPPRPELSDGGFGLELWFERDWENGECDVPRCIQCGNGLPEGVPNPLFSELPGPRNGVCPLCLPFLREKLAEVARLQASTC